MGLAGQTTFPQATPSFIMLHSEKREGLVNVNYRGIRISWSLGILDSF